MTDKQTPKCRNCGRRIEWTDGVGWLHPDVRTYWVSAFEPKCEEPTPEDAHGEALMDDLYRDWPGESGFGPAPPPNPCKMCGGLGQTVDQGTLGVSECCDCGGSGSADEEEPA